MTTPHSKQARINKVGHVMRRTDPDYGFVFSDNYERDWIGGSARRKHNKRAYVYNKANREKAKALKKAQQ